MNAFLKWRLRAPARPPLTPGRVGEPGGDVFPPPRAQLMPFLQVEIDAIKEAQGVAGATGLSLAQVVGGLCLTWAHCWQKKTAFVTRGQLAGFFCHVGADLVVPLVEFGFLDQCEDGAIRVCGAAKYLRVSASRSRGGHASKTNLVPGARHLFSAEAEKEPRDGLGSVSALSPSHPVTDPPIKKDLLASEKVDQPQARSPFAEAQALLVDVYLQRRGCRYKWLGAQDSNALKRILTVATPQEAARMFGVGLEQVGYKETNTVAQLDAKWNDLSRLRPDATPPQARTGPRPLTDEERKRGIYEGQAK